MKRALCNLVFTFAILTAAAFAHPGIGIVVDRSGNIYYTDLKQVWRMDPRGAKTVVVPDVHTHELYMDKAGNLFGEHVYYSGEQDGSGKYQFRVWKRTPDGRISDVVPRTEGFRKNDSFVRDPAGYSYAAGESNAEPKRKIVRKIDPAGRSTLLASGFSYIQWMAMGEDQNLYLIDENDLVRVTPAGQVTHMVRNLGDPPADAAAWSRDHKLMGLAADASGNVYVTNFSAARIKKVTREGRVSTFDRSSGKWAPTGVALANHKLYILESDGLYAVRVRVVPLGSNRK
ncbi:MAG TPA: hypothetical protein VMZ25_08655 [Terriglobales bacterium]|nr:hypothetical protein [Terriglobales bacterium]